MLSAARASGREARKLPERSTLSILVVMRRRMVVVVVVMVVVMVMVVMIVMVIRERKMMMVVIRPQNIRKPAHLSIEVRLLP